MATDLLIRPASGSDTDQILELVRTSLGTGTIPRERAYWEWKHHLNPFGSSPMLVAEAAGELVGLRVFMRWEWEVSGRTIRAVRAVDTATHPEWQGRGIFSRLTRELAERMREEGVEFIFNTPNAQSRPGYLKMGWESVGRVDIWIRPQRALRIARALVSRDGRDALPVAERTDTEVFESAGTVLSRDEAKQFIVALAQQDSGPLLATKRLLPYLKWRYAEVPGFDYRAGGEFDGSDGALVIFRRRMQRSLREVRICDLLVGSSDRSRSAALNLLRRLLADSDADYVATMPPGQGQRGVLIRAGFLPIPRLGPILTVRPLNHSVAATDPLLRGSWAASIGDLELF